MELLYFSANDLLIRIDYDEDMNLLKYWSNRKMEAKERLKIEQHILSEFSQKTGFYEKDTSSFTYVGVESTLTKELSLLHLDNMLKYIVDREQEADKKVKEVVTLSMTRYYFEQIGEEIRSLRGELKSGCDPEHLHDVRIKMSEMLDAYNLYTNQQLALEDILPADLLEYLH